MLPAKTVIPKIRLQRDEITAYGSGSGEIEGSGIRRGADRANWQAVFAR